MKSLFTCIIYCLLPVVLGRLSPFFPPSLGPVLFSLFCKKEGSHGGKPWGLLVKGTRAEALQKVGHLLVPQYAIVTLL